MLNGLFTLVRPDARCQERSQSCSIVHSSSSPLTARRKPNCTVRYAVSIAKLRGADVHLIQVVSRRSGTLWRAPESERRLRARLRALRSAVEQEGGSGTDRDAPR